MNATIDFYFPFIIFAYGSIMTFATHLPISRSKAEEVVHSEVLDWFYSHKILGVVCFFVGGLWSLQRLLF